MNLLLPSLKNILAITTSLVVCIALLPSDYMKFVLQEHGIVESLSVLAWFICIWFIVLSKNMSYKLLALYPLIFAMREIGIKTIFGQSMSNVLKLSYYTDSLILLENKIFFGLLIILLLTVLLLSILLNIRDYLSHIKNRSVSAWYVVLAFLFLIVSQLVLDNNLLYDLLSYRVGFSIYFLAIEEILELMASVLILLASMSVFLEARS